jgi:PKD repeat protein
VNFYATGSSDSDGSIERYEWDYGDGNKASGTGATVSHSYSSSGTYTVELTVTDDDGDTDTTRKTVSVESDDEDTGAIGEVGKLTPNQPDQSTWFTAELRNSYDDPVVIMKPVGSAGDQPAHIRLKNVQGDSFEYKVEEWSHTNDGHKEVDVYYIVLEAGTHELDDGMTVEAGTERINHEFSTIGLSGDYSDTPVAFTQSQTYNGPDQIVTRNKNVDTGSIETRLQEEEGADGEHAYETVGYIAVDQGTGSNDGVPFEVGRTGNVVTDYPHNIGFSQSFGSTPQFVADMQTFDGQDTAEVRMESLNAGSASVYIEEEETGDAETTHGSDEVVGYLAIEDAGSLNSDTDNRDNTGTGIVSGTVTDLENNGLGDAEVRLVESSSDQTVKTTTADSGGVYTFESVETGEYFVEAEFRGDTGQSAIVQVSEDSISTVNVLIEIEDGETGDTLVDEDFEDVSTGTIPNGWTKNGNDDQEVVDTTAVSGDQSLRMKGSHGGCWEAIANRGIDVPDSGSMTVSLSMKPTTDGSSGCHGNKNGKLKLGTDDSSWSAGSGQSLLQFRSDGTVEAGGSSGSYTVDEWNDVRATYERSDGSVTQTVEINGRELSTKTRDVSDFEDDLSYLEIHSGDYTLYVDDVVVKDGADGSNGGENTAPTAEFTYKNPSPETGETITFDASDSSDSDGSIENYEWDFNGDGYTHIGESVIHSYSSPGDYTVTLKVTDEDGATDVTTRTVTVQDSDSGDGGDDGSTEGSIESIQTSPSDTDGDGLPDQVQVDVTASDVQSGRTTVELGEGDFDVDVSSTGTDQAQFVTTQDPDGDGTPEAIEFTEVGTVSTTYTVVADLSNQAGGDTGTVEVELGGDATSSATYTIEDTESGGDGAENIQTSLSDTDGDSLPDQAQVDVVVSDVQSGRTVVELGEGDFDVDASPTGTDQAQFVITQDPDGDGTPEAIEFTELGTVSTTYTVVADLSNQAEGDTGTVEVELGGGTTYSETYTIEDSTGPLSPNNPFGDASNEPLSTSDAADVLFEWNQNGGTVNGVDISVSEMADHLFEWNQERS